jgi:hypothetical protein
MAEQESAEKREKKHLGGELVIPVGALIFTFYYFSTIIDVPWIAQVSAFFVGTILIGLTSFFIFKTIREVRRGNADFSMDTLISPVSLIPKRLCLLGLTLSFILFVEYLGFTITTFLFLCLSMLLLNGGRNKGTAILIAAILSLAGWALFIWAFDTDFPAGPFENMMQRIL